MRRNGFSPTEHRLMMVLADGEPHLRGELKCCLPDPDGSVRALNDHLSRLRAKVQPKGFDVVCVLHARRIAYRYVQQVTRHFTSYSNENTPRQ